MDNAKIHKDPDLIQMIRSWGIIPIFLPPYCPFFNPIEIVFGLVKREMKSAYQEGRNDNLSFFVAKVMKKFEHKDFSKIYNKCGYQYASCFNPLKGEMIDIRKEMDFQTGN